MCGRYVQAVTADSPDGTRKLLAVLLFVLAGFQACLALGMPWGSAAWGGASEGVLPAGLRVASGLAAVVWTWVALVVLGRFLAARGRRRLLLLLAIAMTLAVVMNLATPSVIERSVWAPFSVVVALASWACWWRERRVARRT